MNNPSTVSKDKTKLSVKSTLILVSVSILFAIFLIEITTWMMPQLVPEVIRIYFVDENYTKWGLAPDKDLGLKYAPGLENFPTPFGDDLGQKSSYLVSTVSLGYPDAGFRDDGIDEQAFAVVIGDSFTSCAGVKMEECWVEILEQQSGLDFANLGVITYGPQQTQRMLDKYGLPLEPDLVAWVFYANDPDDAWRFSQFGKAAAREGKFWESPIRSWLVQHSNTYMISAYFWYNRRFFYNLAIRDGEELPLELNSLWWQTMTDPANPTVIKGLELTKASILKARDQAQFTDAEFMIIIIPTREQLYLNDTILQSQLDALTQEMVAFGQQHNIPVVDLTPDMRNRIGQEPFLYFRHDLHLNPQGNKVVAECVQHHLTATVLNR